MQTAAHPCQTPANQAGGQDTRTSNGIPKSNLLFSPFLCYRGRHLWRDKLCIAGLLFSQLKSKVAIPAPWLLPGCLNDFAKFHFGPVNPGVGMELLLVMAFVKRRAPRDRDARRRGTGEWKPGAVLPSSTGTGQKFMFVALETTTAGVWGPGTDALSAAAMSRAMAEAANEAARSLALKRDVELTGLGQTGWLPSVVKSSCLTAVETAAVATALAWH